MIITSLVHCRETIHFIQRSLIKTELNDKAKRLLLKKLFFSCGYSNAWSQWNPWAFLAYDLIYFHFLWYSLDWVFDIWNWKERSSSCNEIYAVLRTMNSATSIKIIRFMRKIGLRAKHLKSVQLLLFVSLTRENNPNIILAEQKRCISSKKKKKKNKPH